MTSSHQPLFWGLARGEGSSSNALVTWSRGVSLPLVVGTARAVVRDSDSPAAL
jgi:hypothetical protein